MYQVKPIPAFNDNYIWCVLPENSTQTSPCIIVDPGDANAVQQFCQANNLSIAAIFITHHHPDHQGGVKALLASPLCNESTRVYGPAAERIQGITHPLTENETVSVNGISFSVFDVPGHTSGHIAYVGNGWLFCGDTLFSGGCGRLFEGTAEQMVTSIDKFRQLPADTRVYPAHEYTLSNLSFARAVEPDNSSLKDYYHEAQVTREKNQPTLPTTIGRERAINPFMRWDEPTIIKAAKMKSQQQALTDSQVFATIRQWKDNF